TRDVRDLAARLAHAGGSVRSGRRPAPAGGHHGRRRGSGLPGQPRAHKARLASTARELSVERRVARALAGHGQARLLRAHRRRRVSRSTMTSPKPPSSSAPSAPGRGTSPAPESVTCTHMYPSFGVSERRIWSPGAPPCRTAFETTSVTTSSNALYCEASR